MLAIGAIFRRYAPGDMPLITLAGSCLDIPDVHSSVFVHCRFFIRETSINLQNLFLLKIHFSNQQFVCRCRERVMVFNL